MSIPSAHKPAASAPSVPKGRRTSIGARRDPRAETAILEAARALLAEKGYSGFSIDEVARRAGAGKPTIYRWWPTRVDLLIDVYRLEKSARLIPPDTGTLAADLEAYTRALWTFWRETPSGRTFRALLAESQTSAPALAALRDKFLPERLKDVQLLFVRGAERGEISASDIEALLTLYIGFNWVHLLTDQLDDDPPAIAVVMRLLASAR